MKISAGFFGSIFTSAGDWELKFDQKHLTYKLTGRSAQIPLHAIASLGLQAGTVWAKITVGTADMTLNCDGIQNSEAERFLVGLREAIANRLLNCLFESRHEIASLVTTLTELAARQQYLSNFDIEAWQGNACSRSHMEGLVAAFRNPFLPVSQIPREFQVEVGLLVDVFSGARKQIQDRNTHFVASEISLHKKFFDEVEERPLTQEQRTSIVTMEDRNLLVASAGSGKTSTIVGKVGYALMTDQYLPEQILVLSFGNATAKELEERIQSRLGTRLNGSTSIKVTTFHSLGLEILAHAQGKKPSVASFSGGGELVDSMLMDELVESLIRTDPTFAAEWVMFQAVCFRPARDPVACTREEWDAYVEQAGDRHGDRRGFMTLQGELVKSQGELAIANWLFLQGVPYEYERPYEYETATREFRQYCPDFYLPEVGAYIEHYALDRHGQPPAAFGAKYAQSMRWKAQLHAEKSTRLIVTTFADFISGALFTNLQRELAALEQIQRPRATEEVLKTIKERKLSSYGSFLRTFLKHAKSNRANPEVLEVRASQSSQPHRARSFLKVYNKIAAAYQSKLRSEAAIDFEDMILDATDEVLNGRFPHDYRLILVDEFQDISQSRAGLLKALLAQRPSCKLFAVGDDWQSIFRFAGGDIDVFTRFSDHFGFTSNSYLTQTFRSNQGIATAASDFVQANPVQLRKSVQSHDGTVDGAFNIVLYSGEIDESDAVSKCLEMLEEHAPGVSRRSIFVLGRYKKPPIGLQKWKSSFPQMTIEYMTVHASKGLQADYAIVIGMERGKYGFPSAIENDPLLHLVLPHPEEFLYAEERRLLYVAMTRARHRVLLVGRASDPSSFLLELGLNCPGATLVLDKSGLKSASDDVCPKCKAGVMVNAESQFGPWQHCSCFPRCKYKRDLSPKRGRQRNRPKRSSAAENLWKSQR